MLMKLQAAMRHAMVAKDAFRLSVIRMLISEVKNEEHTTGKKRSPEDVVSAYYKKLAKNKETFASSVEFAQKVEAEMNVVEEFVPASLSEEDIRQIIGDADLVDVNMKTVMPLLKGKTFDGKMVQAIVTSWGK